VKYMLMIQVTTAGWNAFNVWPKEDLQAHMGFMTALAQELAGTGELVAAEGLAPPDQARVVRAARDGAPVTDGVFPEAKEFLAGYWIVDVENEGRALDIAARASAAPGRGGEPMNMPIEVRQVMSGPPEELL
jgi:hypothetical protein